MRSGSWSGEVENMNRFKHYRSVESLASYEVVENKSFRPCSAWSSELSLCEEPGTKEEMVRDVVGQVHPRQLTKPAKSKVSWTHTHTLPPTS